MKTLINATGNVLAISEAIETLDDRLRAGIVEYPFAALGDGWQILDGEPPTALHTWDGAQWVAPVRPLADPLTLTAKIDADADAIYKGVLGERGEEYTTAEQQAQSFKDAGYTGTPPDSVQSWADAKGWTAQQAADDILATAASWQDARKNIRAARLLRKEQIRSAADADAQDAAMSAWRTFRDGMRRQLGLPPVA